MNPLDLSPNIFGLHSLGAENFFREAGKPGWIALSLNLHSLLSKLDFASLADDGFTFVVELNQAAGKFPDASGFDSFANECADFVAHTRGVKIWVIGSETNRGNVPPAAYAECFARVRAAIKSVPDHHDDWVVPAPPAPDDEYGDWVKYFQDVLFHCAQRGARPDALALHVQTRGYDANLIASEEKSARLPNRHAHLRAYRDFLGAVPPALRHLPVLVTAASPSEWHNENIHWIQNAYAEINAWNADPTHQPIQALCVASDWRPAWQEDMRAALQNDYRVRWYKVEPPPDYRVEWQVEPFLRDGTMVRDETLTARVELKNRGARTWRAVDAPRAQLGMRWFDSHGVEMKMPALVPLARDVAPGRHLAIENVSLRAPDNVGTYVLRFDLQVEGVAWLSALGSPAHEMFVSVVPPDYAAEWIEVVEIPHATIPAKESVLGNVSVKNVGARDWLCGGANPVRLTYTWVDAQTANPVERGDTCAMVADTPGGRVAQFENVSVHAPQTPGTYTLRWELIHEGITPFSAQGVKTRDATIQVTSPIPDWAAKCTRVLAIPNNRLEPNQTVRGDIAAQNVGTQTWMRATVKLAYRWRAEDGQEAFLQANPDEQAFPLASDIAPGSQATFANIVVRAPVQQGRYLLSFDFLREGEWFSAGGSEACDVAVQVQSSAPDYLARWDEIPTLPKIVIADSTLTARVVVANDGALPWASHGPNAVSLRYAWYDEGGALTSVASPYEGRGVTDVLPRESVTFAAIPLRMPTEPGEYTLTFDLQREGAGAFGSPTPATRVTVRPTPREYQAQFSAHDVPVNLPVGAEVNVNLRLRNIGTANWQAFTSPFTRGEDKLVTLAYKWFEREGKAIASAKEWRTSLTREVKTEDEMMIHARLATPRAAGEYDLAWDLLAGDKPFGAPLTLNLTITETETPASYWRAEASHHAEHAHRALDGDVSTAWSSVSPQERGMWFRAYFHSPRVIDALAFRSPGRGHPDGYRVKISAAGDTWQSVKQVATGNSGDVVAAFIPQRVVAAQIELVASSREAWQIAEIALHPNPLWSATASVNDDAAARALQNGAAFWSTDGAQKSGTWFQLNLGRVELVSGLQLVPPKDENPRACMVMVWHPERQGWQRVAQVRDNDAPLGVTFAPIRTQYMIVQLTQDAERPWAIREVRVEKIRTEWVK